MEASQRLDGVPGEVLAAFGLDGAVPLRLPGGQGTAWRAGHVVLKPADSARWPDLIAVSRALHAALAKVSVPSWRATVENPWTIGDEVAWGERDPGPLLGLAAGPLAGQVRSLLAVLRPVGLPSQLIHADLAGNVLFADGLPGAVIDFSPLERPAGLPLAIAAVDALMWHRASPGVLRHLNGEPDLDQMLARALIYRLVTEIVRRAGTDGVHSAARTGQPVTELILARLVHPAR